MSDKPSAPLIDELQQILDSPGPAADRLPLVLDAVLRHFDCVTGTIHRLDAATSLLELCASRNIPEAILDRVRRIPIGKGMAGLAAERRECVQVCNLQTDESGTAKPAARQTQMAGSIAAPMLVDGELRGTIGIARPEEHEFTPAQRELLMQVGERIADRLRSQSP